MVSHQKQDNHPSLLMLSVAVLSFITLLTVSPVALSEESATEISEETYEAPIAVVEHLHSKLLEVMQAGESIDFSERYASLEPTVIESFDTPVIAKVILSRYWKGLAQEQQENFIELFNRQTIATYASRFDSFEDDVFNIKGVEELKKGRILVRSEIQSKNGSSVNLDYLMHRNITKWYIISVIADGVNDLSLKRAEYSTIIKDSGYDSLIMNIEKKIAEMETRKDS